MKITMVLEKLGYTGGREEHNISMLLAFIERGYECSLVYGFETEKPVTDQAIVRVHKHCDPAIPFFAHPKDNTCLKRFLQYMDLQSPDIIYLGNVRNLATLKQIKRKWPTVVMTQDHSLVCLRECKTHYFRRKPCVRKSGIGCLLHGCFLGKSRKANGILRYNSLKQLLAIQSIYKQFAAIVVPSRFMLGTLVGNDFDERRIHVFGYFTEHIPPLTTVVPVNGNVLFVGRVDRYKGAEVLLHAVSKCRTSPRVVIAGDGPFLPKVRRIAEKLGIGNQVAFLGWVPHEKLSEHYDAAAIVAVPSLCPDVLPKVCIEAMAHARPFVAFDVGGISDWLDYGKTGYLVSWKDVDTMAIMIDNIYHDINRSIEIGNMGRKIVIEKLSKRGYLDLWERLLQDTIQAFRKNTIPSAI